MKTLVLLFALAASTAFAQDIQNFVGNYHSRGTNLYGESSASVSVVGGYLYWIQHNYEGDVVTPFKCEQNGLCREVNPRTKQYIQDGDELQLQNNGKILEKPSNLPVVFEYRRIR